MNSGACRGAKLFCRESEGVPQSLDLVDQEIRIERADGHRSRYDARDLRLNCGCAQCLDEWSRRKLLDPVTVPVDIKAEDHLMVGRYAVQFLWSDAHYEGSYPFEVLRSLCQCDECVASRE